MRSLLLLSCVGTMMIGAGAQARAQAPDECGTLEAQSLDDWSGDQALRAADCTTKLGNKVMAGEGLPTGWISVCGDAGTCQPVYSVDVGASVITAAQGRIAAEPVSVLGLGLTAKNASDPAFMAVAAAADAMAAFPQSGELWRALFANASLLGFTAKTFGAVGPASVAAQFDAGGGTLRANNNRSYGYTFSAPMTVLTGGATYLAGGSIYTSPLVLDLNGDGRIGASGGRWQPHPGRLHGPFAAFDMNGDGFAEITEWIMHGDGLLATSPAPSSLRDLVGSWGGWGDGFARLAAFDTDGDGRVAGGELGGLYVWQDSDGDATAGAGEVVPAAALGVEWLGTAHLDFAGLASVAGSKIGLFDWWPSQALVNLVNVPGGVDLSEEPPATLSGDGALGELLGKARVPGKVARGKLYGPIHAAFEVDREALADAGVDPLTFNLLGLRRSGRQVIGSDRSGEIPFGPRLVLLELGARGGLKKARITPLPLEAIFHAAVPEKGRVLIVGDDGSRLLLVDPKSGKITPREPLELAPLGLRASGVSGVAQGGFWLTAWQLDSAGILRGEYVWSLGRKGLERGMSLDALDAELGGILGSLVTGPESGYFVAPSGEGVGLWAVDGAARTLVDTADAIGGVAALPDGVAWVARHGGLYHVEVSAGGAVVTVAASEDPLFYFNSAPGLEAVTFAGMTLGSTEVTHWAAAAEDGWTARLLLDTGPGQAKLTSGAFVHHGPGGLLVTPLPFDGD